MCFTYDMNIYTVNYTAFKTKPLSRNYSQIKHCKNLLHTEHQKGKIDEHTFKLLNEIGELFETAHATIKSIAKSCNTRNAVKNGYKRLKKGISGSRILEFAGIGKNGEDISINLRVDHKATKSIITIDDNQLIINPKGEIEINPSMKFVNNKTERQKGDTVQYFTQDEIDEMNVNDNLYALKSELQSYISYINSRRITINNIRELKKERPSGNLNNYANIIKSVDAKFDFFKKTINKLSYNTLDKDIFRIMNKIKTFHAQNSIMLKNATPDDRSVYLVYSKINKKKAMKIFVMDYNNKTIDKSFIIYDNKLAKFFPKRVNQKPSHLDYDFHYYTQEEINSSCIDTYLKIIDDKLSEINENLVNKINERINK